MILFCGDIPHAFHSFGVSVPLRQNNINLHLGVAHKRVHLDVISVVAKWVFQLRADPFYAIKGEYDQAHDWYGPPAHLIYHGKRQHTTKQGKDLLLVDT